LTEHEGGATVTTKVIAIIGFIIGLIVACSVLCMIYFGVSGILMVGNTDLMYLVWPSGMMLLIGWHTTMQGIMTTLLAVVINCFLYLTVALLLRALILWAVGVVSPRKGPM
jgi:hypothetical protein